MDSRIREGIARWSVLLVLCSSVTVTVGVSEGVAQELDETTKREMLGYIKEANALYKQEQWLNARELYRKAYALSPKPALLYRMGRASEGAGEVREAIGYYEQFILALPENDKAREVAATLPDLKATLAPTVTITAAPVSANIYLESLGTSPIGSTPYEGEFSLGEVTIIVRADGYEPYSQTYTFEGAEQERLDVTLVPSAETTQGGVADNQTLEPQAPLDEPAERGGKLKVAGWSSLGAGLALLGAGGIMSTLQQGATEDVNTYNKQGAPDPVTGRRELDALKNDAEGYWRNSIIFYSIGGALTAAGVGLIAVGRSRDARSDQAPLTWHFGAAPGAGARVGVSTSF